MDRNDRRFSITMPQELAAELAAEDWPGAGLRPPRAGAGRLRR